jgi:hypothetical protein
MAKSTRKVQEVGLDFDNHPSSKHREERGIISTAKRQQA